MSNSLSHVFHPVAQVVTLLKDEHDYKVARNYCYKNMTEGWTYIMHFDEVPLIDWHFENANEALHFKLKFSGSTS